jgi:hypothetical protein
LFWSETLYCSDCGPVQHAGGGAAQLSVADDEPLMVMGTVEPELVSVAEPVTVQLPFKLHVPDAVSVAVVPVGVKVMVPGNVVGQTNEGIRHNCTPLLTADQQKKAGATIRLCA